MAAGDDHRVGPEREQRLAELERRGALAQPGQRPRLGQVRRQHRRPRQHPLDQRRLRVRVEQRRAALGDHHRVDDHGRAADQVERLEHRIDRRLVGEHPDLDRVDADVARRPRATWATIISGGTGVTISTPTVFCAVSAVIAVIPCTPQRANAFRSAWIPAPPPESEPAIARQVGTRLMATS